jgi:hypothetical protein
MWTKKKPAWIGELATLAFYQRHPPEPLSQPAEKPVKHPV